MRWKVVVELRVVHVLVELLVLTGGTRCWITRIRWRQSWVVGIEGVLEVTGSTCRRSCCRCCDLHANGSGICGARLKV